LFCKKSEVSLELGKAETGMVVDACGCLFSSWVQNAVSNLMDRDWRSAKILSFTRQMTTGLGTRFPAWKNRIGDFMASGHGPNCGLLQSGLQTAISMWI